MKPLSILAFLLLALTSCSPKRCTLNKTLILVLSLFSAVAVCAQIATVQSVKQPTVTTGPGLWTNIGNDQIAVKVTLGQPSIGSMTQSEEFSKDVWNDFPGVLFIENNNSSPIVLTMFGDIWVTLYSEKDGCNDKYLLLNIPWEKKKLNPGQVISIAGLCDNFCFPKSGSGTARPDRVTVSIAYTVDLTGVRFAAQMQVATTAFNNGNMAGARSAAQEAQQIDDNQQVRDFLATVLAEEARLLALQEAESRRQAELDRQISAYNTALRNGDRAAKISQYAKAISHYEDALRILPEETEPRNQINNIQAIMRDVAEAKKKAEEEAAKKVEEEVKKAEAAKKAEEEKHNLEHQTDVEVNPTDQDVKSDNPKQDALAYLKAGDDAWNRKDWDSAISNYERALDLDPASWIAKNLALARSNKQREERMAKEGAANEAALNSEFSKYNEDAQESGEMESENSGDSEAKNNPSKVEQFEQMRNYNTQDQYENVYDWDAAASLELFENSALELRRKIDEMQAKDKSSRAFWASLVISNKLTPEDQIQHFRQKLVSVQEKHDRTVQQGINDARSLANEHSSKEGLIAAAVVAGSVAAIAKAEERKVRETLKKELTQNFREIQRELLKAEEPNIENNKHAAANSVDSKREASYINWVNYWECRVSRIKGDFSIYKTNWIDPNCTPANKSIPSEIANPSVNDLFKSAKRKYSSGVDYLIQAANPILDAALGKDPENIEILFTRYKWNRETACLWKSKSNPARDYLEICLNLAPSYSFAIEAMLWELANDDHLEASYLAYLKKYPAGLFAKDAQKGVDYFRQVSEINRLIKIDQRRSAVVIHAPLEGIYPEFFKSSDMPNVHLLRPIYADIEWNNIKYGSGKNNTEKLLTKLRAYYNFKSEYADISKTYNVGYKINNIRNNLAGRTFTMSLNTALLGQTDIESMYDHGLVYFGTSADIVDERHNLPAVYSSTNPLNSIEMAMDFSRTLVTIAGPIYLAGIGGFSLGPFMLNRKITLNQGQTDQELYTALTESEYNIPEYLYYREPIGSGGYYGLSLSNVISLCFYHSQPPEIGSGAVVDNKYEENYTWGEALWLDENGDDKIYTKGYRAILQLPLDKKHDFTLIGNIDYFGGEKLFDNDAPYKRIQMGINYKLFFCRYTSSKYTLEQYTFLPEVVNTEIDWAAGNYSVFRVSSGMSITYTSIEIGIRFDVNKNSRLYRRGTARENVFEDKRLD
jgi:hypothetical protein